MSEYYKGKRTRNVYLPGSSEPFKLSRSRIELFMNCPRCFYLDRRLGVDRPPGFPFTLNSAVDKLLKKEFDIHRARGTKHPLMEHYKIDAIPVPHEKLDIWRENFKGIEYWHKPANLLITGAIDDLWQNPQGEYIVVDYKSTSKDEEIKELDKAWQDGYKRQMEIYQWLLRQNGYKVSDTGYFVYCNGDTDKAAFDAKLEFAITIIPYKGDDSWIEGKIIELHKCLNSDTIPEANPDCDYCTYFKAREDEEKKNKKNKKKKLEAEEEFGSDFPWADIEACRHNKTDFDGKYDPDNLIPLHKTCPKCGGLVERFYFSSPAWTWEKMVGRAGWMEACFNCKIEIWFELGIMN